MTEQSEAYLIANVGLPATTTFAETVKKLSFFIPEFIFTEEETGRFEEVPAFIVTCKNCDLILFGIPEDEVSDYYLLEFTSDININIDEFRAIAPKFIASFIVNKHVNHRGYLDYSNELATTLQSLGYDQCKALPQQ